MAFKIKIPLIDQEPSDIFRRDLITQTPSLVSKYGAYFRAAGYGTNIPVPVLYAMAMIESTGRHTNNNGSVIVTGTERSTGMMQISPGSFYEGIKKEIRGNRLSQQSQAIIRKYLPGFSFTMGKSIPGAPEKALLDQIARALQSPEFNIWASAIVLRRLLEESASNDKVMRLDKAIVKYNAGEYHSSTRTTEYKFGDTSAIMKVIPVITRSYIVKAVGKNAALEYMIKNSIS